MQKPHGVRSVNTGHANAAPRLLNAWFTVTHLNCIAYKSYRQMGGCPVVRMSSHGEPLRGRLNGMVFLQVESRGHYGGAYCVQIFQNGFDLFFSVSVQTAQLVVEMVCDFFFFLPCLKKASLLLEVVLLPQGQAVKLIQGHVENLTEFFRGQVSLEMEHNKRIVQSSGSLQCPLQLPV